PRRKVHCDAGLTPPRLNDLEARSRRQRAGNADLVNPPTRLDRLLSRFVAPRLPPSLLFSWLGEAREAECVVRALLTGPARRLSRPFPTDSEMTAPKMDNRSHLQSLFLGVPAVCLVAFVGCGDSDSGNAADGSAEQSSVSASGTSSSSSGGFMPGSG